MTKAEDLIKIILDKNSSEIDREEAVFDIYKFKNPLIEDVLIAVIADENEDFDLRCDACESLVGFWQNIKEVNPNKIKNLPNFYVDKIIFFVEGMIPAQRSLFKNI